MLSSLKAWSWHEAPTRLLDYPGAEQDQGFFDFCGLPCLSQWLGHDNPTAAQVKIFSLKSSCLALVHNKFSSPHVWTSTPSLQHPGCNIPNALPRLPSSRWFAPRCPTSTLSSSTPLPMTPLMSSTSPTHCSAQKLKQLNSPALEEGSR